MTLIFESEVSVTKEMVDKVRPTPTEVQAQAQASQAATESAAAKAAEGEKANDSGDAEDMDAEDKVFHFPNLATPMPRTHF